MLKKQFFLSRSDPSYYGDKFKGVKIADVNKTRWHKIYFKENNYVGSIFNKRDCSVNAIKFKFDANDIELCLGKTQLGGALVACCHIPTNVSAFDLRFCFHKTLMWPIFPNDCQIIKGHAIMRLTLSLFI